MNTTEEIEEQSDNVMVMLSVVSIVILTLSVIFNSLGIYLLKQLKSTRNMNQIYILMSLSFSEVLLGLIILIHKLVIISGLYERSSIMMVYCDQIAAALFFTYYSILFILTSDRLLAFVLHLKYPRIVTTKRTTCCLLVAWISGFTLIFPFFFHSADIFYMIWYQYIYLILDGITLVTVFVTYSYIFIKTSRNHMTVSSRAPRREKMCFVIGIIILTFVLLVVIPDILYANLFVIHKVGSDLDGSIIGMCWELNYLTDPCVYIFLQRNVRNVLREKVSKVHRQASQETSFTPQDIISRISSTSNHVRDGTLGEC